MSEIAQQPVIELPPLEANPRRSFGRRLLRWAGRLVGGLIALVLAALIAAGAWAGWLVGGSKPQLDGERRVAGLTAPVTVERDAQGVPTVRGAARRDVAAGLGFLHAQERFFQMDLLRRQAAGEMAELIGPPVLPLDRRYRLHRLRARAAEVLAAAPLEQLELLTAYADGVNAGLAGLRQPPFEYLLLSASPRAWEPTDSVLVLYAMFLLLQDEGGHYDAFLGSLHQGLPPELLAFLTPQGGPWDAPVIGPAFATPVPPGPEVVDLRAALPRAAARSRGDEPPSSPPSHHVAASNAWALSGRRTADGRALLAVDMHLQLMVPNLWYRAVFSWPAAAGAQHRVVGVTLPGVPLMVVGSNGRVAWGFTNGRADTTDLVEIVSGEAAGTYRSPSGEQPLRVFREAIAVKGGDGEELVVEETEWGPLVAGPAGPAGPAGGGRRAVRWVAHDADAVDFGLLAIERCGDVTCALAVGKASGLPAMNLIAADAGGHIGWTVAGKVPRRVGVDGRYPAAWHLGGVGWDGWLSPEEVPTVVDPPSGALWSGNNRMVDGEALARLGDGNYTVGSRAGQARDRLLALEAARPADLLELQLDDRALFLAPWQRLMRQVLAGAGDRGERWAEMRRLVESWEGRAAAGSAGYLLVRDFREEVAERAFPPLLDGVAGLDAETDLLGEHPRAEAALWALVEERPEHLLDPSWEDWDALLIASAEGVLARAAAEDVPLAERTWGRKNTLALAHLFSGALPVGRGLLSMPAEPLAGDEFMPRVQGPDYGASQRLVVAPGAEEDAIFQMPGGQSGHPFSKHFRGGHEAWVAGAPAPLFPGAEAHVLVLLPESVR